MASTDTRPAPDDADLGAWQRVADELRACREMQRRAWGDIDSAEIGRYLAGEADPADAARIEHALEELPELRKLTELVRDVLGDPGLVAGGAPPAAHPPAPGPALLRFEPRPARRRGAGGWLRRHAPLVAAACLAIILGAAMPPLSPLGGPREGLPLTDGRASLGGGREPAADLPADGGRDRLMTAAPVSLAALTRDPKEADFPGLPRDALDATKRGLHLHQRDGDLTKAEHELSRAVASCRNTRTPNARAAANTVRLLADVYQVALNTEAEAPTRAVAFEVGRDRAAADSKAEAARRTSALLLREQIAAKPVHEVRTTVVPVLTEALQVAPEPQERRRLLQALARLGPAADTALPALTACLTRTTDLNEAREVLAVIEQMGPGGQPALPVLARLGGVPSPKSAAAPPAAREAAFRFKAQPDDRKRAAEIHARLKGREGRVGVRDQAGVFSVRATREATRSLLTLARHGNVEVLVETAAGAPVKCCDHQDRALGRALVVRVYLKGPVVRAEAGDDLKDGQQLARRVEGRLLGAFRKKEYDKALRELVASLPPPAKGAQPR